MDNQKRIVEELYGEENLKEIFRQILKQEFMKDYEEKILKGWKCNEKIGGNEINYFIWITVNLFGMKWRCPQNAFLISW